MNMTRPINHQHLPPPGSHRTKLLAPAIVLLCLVVQCQGQGTMTVRFEGQTSPLGGYRESGMIFQNAFGGPEVLTLVQSGWTGYPDNGSQYLGSGGVDLLTFGFNTSPTTYFNLVSLDLAELFPVPVTLQVIGYPAMSAPVTNTITTDGIMDGPGGQPDFQTFSFDASFQHLNRVQITTDQWYLDNVLISGVPEPSAGALVLLGAACAFGRSRIKRRTP